METKSVFFTTVTKTVKEKALTAFEQSLKEGRRRWFSTVYFPVSVVF